MTETERLRELLDERGVGYREHRWGGKHSITTIWHAMGAEWHYRENGHGELRLHVDDLTPEQAVEATLGRPTCRLEREPDSDRLWWCSNCQSYHEHVSEFPWEDCPRCGAKVVS